MTNLADTVTLPHGAILKNRFVQSPMLTNSGVDGAVSPATINYYGAHANSGAMVITGYVYVSEDGGPALSWRHDRTQLAVYDDRFIPGLAKVAAAIKRTGNRAIMQLAHTGREAAGRVALYNQPVMVPSAMDFPFLPYRVHTLSDAQVRAIVADFAAATKRAIAAGFDGVEIHGANHYLIQQFFSTYSNHRDDHWGGSLAKRMNFPLAVAQAVSEAARTADAPADFIVGYRISPEEINPDNVGYSWHESTQLVDALMAQADLDYLHLSMGRYDEKPADSEQTFAQLFRPRLAAGTKLIVVGGVNSGPKAQAAIADADLVAVGRENLIDPAFATKVLTGQTEHILQAITPEQAQATHMTPGMIENFASPATKRGLAGRESLAALHPAPGGWGMIDYPANSPEMK